MALIVAPEDGFNSLVGLEDAAQYMEDFGHNWPVTAVPQPPEGEATAEPDPAEVRKAEVALRRATQYVLSNYAIDPQYLAPVAQKVKDACCEAAWRAAKGELLKDTDGRVVTEKTVDVITTKYAEGNQGGQMRYPVIDALLKGMTIGSGLGLKLVRG